MKITRIDQDRNMDQPVEYIVIMINDKEYRLSENFGKLNINGIDGALAVYPGVSNVIEIDSNV